MALREQRPGEGDRMGPRLLRRTLSLAALGSLTASLGVAAAPPPAMAQSPAAVARAAAGTPAPRSRPVLLITGVRLAVLPGPGGRPVMALMPPAPSSSPGAELLTMGHPGHVSEVPADALPFLGRGLDPALFSVT